MCSFYVAPTPYSNVINMYIGDFAIAPRHQGKGFGKELMNRMEAIAKKEKCERIILTVHDNNNQAMRFYEGFDFKPTRHVLEKEI